DHDVTQVEADAQYDTSRLRQISVRDSHPSLAIYGALHPVDRAAELDKHPVASNLEKATLVPGHERFQHFLAAGLQHSQSSGFVLFHEAAIGDHVCRQDGSKAALNASFGHERQLLQKME